MEAFERVVVVVAEPAAPMGGSGSSSATAVKSSQPLHNFSLPFLKWGNQTNKNKNTNNNNNNSNNNNSSSSSSRCRKLVDSSSRDFSPSRDRRSSPSEPDSADEEGGGGGGGGGYRRGGGRNGSGNGGDGSSRRFSFANCAAGAGTSAAGMESNGGTEGEELVELVQKPWNLRPRRSAGKAAAAASEIAAACKNGELGEKIENLPKSGRLRSMAEGHQSVEKEKKKRRLVISLSRDEVDEDFFIMTGSKASRRPKKRPKNIQKLVDSGLPGLWLVGLTADSYTIPDVPAKK